MTTIDAVPSRERPDVLVVGGNMVALVTVMLPASGFVIRLAAFGVSPSTSTAADTLAWSAPIGQLAFTGLPSVFLTLAIVTVAGIAELTFTAPPRFGRRLTRTVAIAFVLASLGYGLFIPWPREALFALTFPLAIGLAKWSVRLRRQGYRLTYRHGWILAVPVLLVGSLVYGLDGTPASVTMGSYAFAPGAGLKNGTFVQLGDDGNVVLLEQCPQPRSLNVVNRNQVLSESRLSGAAGDLVAPSVAAMLFQGRQPGAGYQPPC